MVLLSAQSYAVSFYSGPLLKGEESTIGSSVFLLFVSVCARNAEETAPTETGQQPQPPENVLTRFSEGFSLLLLFYIGRCRGASNIFSLHSQIPQLRCRCGLRTQCKRRDNFPSNPSTMKRVSFSRRLREKSRRRAERPG